MKKITVLLTIASIAVLCYFCCGFLYSSSVNALAEESTTTQPSWVRITEKDVWLYKTASSAESEKLFLLQYSYYAKVKEITQNGFYHVEILDNVAGFVKVLGYVPIDKVTPQTETPLSPTYPTVFSTVNQNNIILFSQANVLSNAVCAVYQGQTLSYFGSYPTADKTWYFVRFEQHLCYVDANSVTLPAIALHPTPVHVQTVTPPAEETPPTDVQDDLNEQPEPQDNFSKWQIVIVALIALSAVVIVVVLFLPAKPKEQKTATFDAKDLEPQNITLDATTQNLTPHYFDDYL